MISLVSRWRVHLKVKTKIQENAKTNATAILSYVNL